MTAKAEEEFSKKMVDEGALAVMKKPFDAMKLSDEIIAIWEGKQG